MNDNKSQYEEWEKIDCDSVDLEELESKLESYLESQMTDLRDLELEEKKIGSPDSLGETVKNVVWEQFINQVGGVAGEDFIKENRNLTLDLRDSAHIQTTENFENGNIATHNDRIDYQKRYKDWQSNFQHDADGNVITHQTRSGREEPTLVKGAREPFDKGRPSGNVERGTDMDHTVSAGEIIRDPAANAHLAQEEQIKFANSNINLNEMPSGENRSKGDKPMTDWLDNQNKNGQKPNEIFDIDKGKDVAYRKKDAEARAEFEKRKEEGEQRSVETGKQSQKDEALRIGKDSVRAALMVLLASLIKEVIAKLIEWFKSADKKFSTFIDSVKNAIKTFVSKLKENILNAGNAFFTSIVTAIFGPVIGVLKKVWILLKKGYQSIKEAISFLKNPANAKMPFSLKMMEVGKILIVGLTAGGAIVLSEVIEKGLMTIPGFQIQIPLLGSLASIIGMFLGGLVCGLIGALALNLIDRMISKKLKKQNLGQQIFKKNEIIKTENQLVEVVENNVNSTIKNTFQNIHERHVETKDIIGETLQNITQNMVGHEENAEAIAKNGECITKNNEKQERNAKIIMENEESIKKNWEEFNKPIRINTESNDKNHHISSNEDAFNIIFNDLKSLK